MFGVMPGAYIMVIVLVETSEMNVSTSGRNTSTVILLATVWFSRMN